MHKSPLDLHCRKGWPEDFLFLLRAYPRDAWCRLTLHETGRNWLQVHDWLREMVGDLRAVGDDLRAGRVDLQSFESWAMPRLDMFVQILEIHHEGEGSIYFPAFVRTEQRLKRGLECLEHDHRVMDVLLNEMDRAGVALAQSVARYDAQQSKRAAETLLVQVDAFAVPLQRHLDDEEDLIVPFLLAYGDPVSSANSA